MSYAHRSIKGYLGHLAARTPAPGGGSAAALSGALGCALLSMAANWTLGKEKYKHCQKEIKQSLARSERLRRRFTELVDLDAKYYLAFSRARDKTKKQKAKQQSQKVVKEIARLSRQAMPLCQLLAEKGNACLLNDVLAAAELMRAAFESAKVNIKP
ncbi:MAG: cyclodeaminase/cyclohydrolase family protein [Candidatus Omnitrophota bacterium]